MKRLKGLYWEYSLSPFFPLWSQQVMCELLPASMMMRE